LKIFVVVVVVVVVVFYNQDKITKHLVGIFSEKAEHYFKQLRVEFLNLNIDYYLAVALNTRKHRNIYIENGF